MRSLALVLVTVLLCLCPLSANWGGGAGGSLGTGTFRPFGTDQVEMQKENLVIALYRDRARVNVDYLLHNSGEAVDVKAGFPCLGLGPENHLEIEDYRLTVDGKETSYQVERGDARPYQSLIDAEFLKNPSAILRKNDPDGGPCHLWWLSSTVPFAAGQTRKVHIDYESLYEYSYGGPSGVDNYYNNGYFRYLLSTGGAWKGPIRQGKVTITGVTVNLQTVGIKPEKRFHSSPEGRVWAFSDLEPTLADNLEVCLNDKYYTIHNFRGKDHSYSWYSFEGNRYFFDHNRCQAIASSASSGYPATNVLDRKRDTAWVAGLGEQLTLTLETPDRVDQLGIIPGYTKSKDLYFANNRVRELEVSVNAGAPFRVTLPDDFTAIPIDSPRAYQTIDLGGRGKTTRTIALRVTKVYPGARHDDTCISEVLLRKRLPKKPEVRGAR